MGLEEGGEMTEQATRKRKKREPIQIPVLDCLDASVLEELYDEMDSWASNMEGTNLENSSKYEEVSQARDDIDSVKDSIQQAIDDVRDAAEEAFTDLAEVSITFLPSSGYKSRAKRWDECLSLITQAAEHIKGRAEVVLSNSDEALEKLEALVSACDELIDEVEQASVDFPGMY